MTIPAGATNLVIQMSGGTGDADLYVKFGQVPTTGSYDCRPYLVGNNETCSFATPSAGVYHILIFGDESFSGVTLSASYQTRNSKTVVDLTPILNLLLD